MKPSVSLAILGSLVFAGSARANGMPAGYSAGTPGGGLVPRNDDQVSLVSEELTIRMLGDGLHYRAEARYHLKNPGPLHPVLYAVPLRTQALGWPAGETPVKGRPAPEVVERRRKEAQEAREALRKFLEERPCNDERQIRSGYLSLHGLLGHHLQRAICLAQKVRIRVGEQEHRCALETEPFTSGKLETPQRPDNGTYAATSWCTAPIEIPSGESTLVLEFEGLVEFDLPGREGGDPAMWPDDTAELRYQLSPAGGWKGGKADLKATVEPGPFSGMLKVKSGHAFRPRNGALVLESKGFDFAKAKDLVVEVPIGRVYRALANRYRAEGESVEAKASSALDADHDAAKAADGRLDTAWCPETGKWAGEWIELTVKRAGPADFSMLGFVVSAGDARSLEAFTKGAKLTRLKLSGCEADAKKIDVAIALPKAGSPVFLAFPMEKDAGTKGAYLSTCTGKALRAQVGADLTFLHAYDPAEDLAFSAEWPECARGAYAELVLEAAQDLADSGKTCLRLEIAEITGPKGAPLCLSEIAPVLYEDQRSWYPTR